MAGRGRSTVVAALMVSLGACGSGPGGTGQGSAGATSGSGGAAVGTGGAMGTGGQVGTGGRAALPSGTGGAAVGAGSGGTGTGGVAGSATASGGARGQGTGGASTGGAGGTTAGTGGATPSGTGGAVLTVPLAVTSAEGAYWQTGALTLATATGTADVTVYPTLTYQTFAGFGGSFTERGWTALSALSPGDRAQAMTLLFGPQGVRLTVGRVPIGATDYALDRYSLDVTDSDSTTDYAMDKFSIARDRQNLIPYIQAALALKSDLRLIADPWTPPVWMKKGPFSSSNTPSNYDGGAMMDQPEILAAYSLYLLKFVQEYAKLGIAIDSVAPQSDPTFQFTFPSCQWTPDLYAIFIHDYLGPQFLAAGVTAKIMLGMLANNDMDNQIATAVMTDTVARSFIGEIGVENNMLSSLSTLTSYGLPVLQTQQDPGNDQF